MSSIDWISIKNEYINTTISYRKLAEKYSVSLPTVAKKSKEENWIEHREQNLHKTCTEVIQKTSAVIVKAEVNRISVLLDITDGLSLAAQKAIDQLSSILHDGEIVDVGMIDTFKMKQIASVAKDLKEIQSALQGTTSTQDNGLNTAIEQASKELWIDEISDSEQETIESADMVGGSPHSEKI